MIREATNADIPAIVAMATAFNRSTEYREHVDAEPDRIAIVAQTLIDNDDALVLVHVAPGAKHATGLLAMMMHTNPLTGQRVAMEVVWWMDPTERGRLNGTRLLEGAEAWARANGAVAVQMIAPNEHVARFYERAGYRFIESNYLKKV